ncbi:TRAP transporter small permease [Lutibaculum baratangense]|uniref:TRAP transporter small permease protein n=1 Tax=Lutibaculum baratangense AMV1 TaxID=631454 RepID=V4TMR3_9HYPH|nr:TRAP transporter small permease [Lutibaculum baratangense]ESR27033.1 TRAP-type transport system, small permease component, predicted N-acetylneuraminate transporter [Lutibaculum baratangense AMV1]
MPYSKLHDGVVTICRIGTGVAFAVLIATVLIQVVGRSILNSSPPWTEELTRYALLWLVAFGAGLSLRSGDLVNVDIVSEALPGRWPWRLRLFSALATAGLCLVLIYPAWRFTSIGVRQTSPVLAIRMDFIHASIVALLVLLALFALMRAAAMLTGRSDGYPTFNAEPRP